MADYTISLNIDASGAITSVKGLEDSFKKVSGAAQQTDKAIQAIG